jgi:hypothetical protein
MAFNKLHNMALLQRQGLFDFRGLQLSLMGHLASVIFRQEQSSLLNNVTPVTQRANAIGRVSLILHLPGKRE